MAGNSKRDSVLVDSVVSLQQHLWDLERLGTKINATDMTSDIDVEYVQKLLIRFAESGARVSQELAAFAAHLQQAQSRAESIAQNVSRQTEVFNIRRQEQHEQLERFQMLGERVRELNTKIGGTEPDALLSALPDLTQEVEVLIGELDDLRSSARNSRMKDLEKSAHSLGQSLQAVHSKLRSLTD